MSSRRNISHNLFGAVLLFLLLGGFAYFSSSNHSEIPQGGAPADTQPEGIPELDSVEPISAASVELPGILVALKNGETTSLVWRTDTDEKVVFTDNDEDFKISRFLGRLKDGRVAAWVGAGSQDPVGRLIAIDSAGSGSYEILAETISISPPAINSEGNQLATISFDNAERSFGFTLKSRSVGASAETVVYTNQEGISLPTWNGAKLAFIAGQASPDSGLPIYVWNEGEPEVIGTSESGRTITDLIWAGDNLTFVSESISEVGEAKIEQVVAGQLIDLVDQPGREHSLVSGGNGGWIGFVTGELDGNGEVWLLDTTSGQSVNRGQAHQLVAIGGVE